MPLRLSLSPITITVLTLLVSGCAAVRSVTFTSQEPGSELTLVPIENPDSTGVKLKNPALVTGTILQKGAVRITAQGKAPVYFFSPGDSGRRVDIRVKSLPQCKVDQAEKEVSRNRPLRLVLKAYQALTAKDFNLARELAAQAAELDTTLAGPYIISGLAHYQEGKKEAARLAFNKAKGLDPEDQEITVLLRLVQ